MMDFCLELHKLFNGMKRLSAKDIDKIKIENGIYIFFEKGEKYHDYDRIVRVGTDTGQNNLKSRLVQHYIKENKDRSIFRKNIGRAILNRDGSPLLDYWNKDLTKKENKDKFFDQELSDKQKLLEKVVSDYLDKNMTFVVFQVDLKSERLRLESGIISALYHSEDFKASCGWLGNYVPQMRNNNVQKSGMWLSQGLKARPLTEEEFQTLKRKCEKINENSVDILHEK